MWSEWTIYYIHCDGWIPSLTCQLNTSPKPRPVVASAARLGLETVFLLTMQLVKIIKGFALTRLSESLVKLGSRVQSMHTQARLCAVLWIISYLLSLIQNVITTLLSSGAPSPDSVFLEWGFAPGLSLTTADDVQLFGRFCLFRLWCKVFCTILLVTVTRTCLRSLV